jgi:membrane protein YdbS with pleckstrin-like domain
MSGAHRATQWIYRGVWGALVRWLRLPDHPPELPLAPGESATTFRPSEGFLRYLKFLFWLFLWIPDVALAALWVVILVNSRLWAAITALPLFLLAVVPDVLAYIAIHVRYDTTWTVMTPRSLRIRRGVLSLNEATVTFENIQNVTVTQGPLQRWFGIADVTIQTAGGGGGGPKGQHAGGHLAMIEGVAHATEIRDQILEAQRRSRSAGLGDEAAQPPSASPSRTGLGDAHIAALREIRDELRAAVRAA